MNATARTQTLQIATLVLLAVIVYLLLNISSKQEAMSDQPQGIGQTIWHGAKADNPIETERLDGETAKEWLDRHKFAVEAASEEGL